MFRNLIIAIVSSVLLSACLVIPVATRYEVLQKPSQVITVDMPIYELVTLWDENRPSACTVDGDTVVSLVNRLTDETFEIRFGVERAVYYGLITLEPQSTSRTTVTVYDYGALPCIPKHARFFKSLAS
jgi:hypothetical protein